MGVTCGTHRGDGNVCSILVGKPEGKRKPGRPKRRREVNIFLVVLLREP
jgi:hypothetical protein